MPLLLIIGKEEKSVSQKLDSFSMVFRILSNSTDSLNFLGWIWLNSFSANLNCIEREKGNRTHATVISKTGEWDESPQPTGDGNNFVDYTGHATPHHAEASRGSGTEEIPYLHTVVKNSAHLTFYPGACMQLEERNDFARHRIKTSTRQLITQS